MPKPIRPFAIDGLHVALLWVLAALAWLAVRAGLNGIFQAPWVGPGLFVLLALLGASAWAVLEEPRVSDAKTVLGWALGLLCLGAGQALLYDEFGGKDAVAPLGFGLMLLGAACCWPAGRGRKVAMGTAGLLLAVGAAAIARRVTIAWDLFQGPLQGQISILAFWLLLALGVAALAWQSGGVELSHHHAPLTRKQEAWGLAAILLLGAFLRFYHAGQLPQGYWYDEINLARSIQEDVLTQGRAPLYVGEQVENPGAWLWIGAALFKVTGVSLPALRVLSGLFGLLAVIPLWGLARLWVGGRWALVAAALYACMRWTLIPQRIAFMSGFALFWMLAAFWALWWAWLKGAGWRFLLAGLALGANLHTYTPARFVPVIAGAFLLLQLMPRFRAQGPRLGLRELGALAAGFLVSAGPMLWYIASNWAEYSLRAKQVSIFTDVAKSGKALAPELWGTLAKHLLMFNFRGDFNARHNLHFLPHVDLLTAAALFLAAPVLLGQAFRNARARFLLLWIGAMLAAGAFTMPVEAPQGHRTVLAAPAIALTLALCLPMLLTPLREAWGGRWPVTLKALGAVLLLGALGWNSYELLAVWPTHPATYRSFSPRASAVLRAIQASQPGTAVFSSELPAEYQFHGFEWGVFARFALRQGNRQWIPLRPGAPLPLQVPAQCDGMATRSALLIWGESDQAVTDAMASQYPDITVHKEPNLEPSAGEPSYLYLSAEIPYERIPAELKKGASALLQRQP
jgi:hypothetical protein